MTVEAFAPAKINLTLHVTGQRADGYHLLDSLVVFADIGDKITVMPAREGGLELTVTGPKSAGVPTDDSNLVIKAARLSGLENARIHLEKHLPAEAGIGGGSSDAAATLRAISQATDLKAPVGCELLGADVPVCLRAHAARMQGVGERVKPVAGLPPLPAVLVNPGIPVATPPVFKALNDKVNTAMPATLPSFTTVEAVADWLMQQRNDLQTPATLLHPGIQIALDALSETQDALIVRMSGSGSSCFALYPSSEAAQSAAQNVRVKRADWWVQHCTLQ